MYPTTHLSASERADLHARARSQAQALRRAAAADFWHGVRRLGANAVRAASQGLHRLAHLSRHPSGV